MIAMETPSLVATPTPRPGPRPVETPPVRGAISVRSLDFFYGDHQALHGNDLEILPRKVTAIIGPSGCGKSTHIRVYNRVFELHRNQRCTGQVLLDGHDIYSDVQINIVQAALGTTVPVKTLDGTVQLRIPPGTSSGTKLRLRGKGAPKPGGGRGDHYVRVKITAPKNLTPEQAELLRQFARKAGLQT